MSSFLCKFLALLLCMFCFACIALHVLLCISCLSYLYRMVLHSSLMEGTALTFLLVAPSRRSHRPHRISSSHPVLPTTVDPCRSLLSFLPIGFIVTRLHPSGGSFWGQVCHSPRLAKDRRYASNAPPTLDSTVYLGALVIGWIIPWWSS